MDQGHVTLGPFGLYARVGNRTYRASGLNSAAPHPRVMLRIDEADRDRFDDVSPGPHGLRARVPITALDGLVRVRTSATFDGRRVDVMEYHGDRAWISAGGPSWWGEMHGFSGSQYEDFRGVVPVDELTDVDEQVEDVLAKLLGRPRT